MEDMIDAFSRLDTSFVRCEISRSNSDFVSEMRDPSMAFCELIRNDDIRATRVKFLSQERSNKSGSTSYEYPLFFPVYHTHEYLLAVNNLAITSTIKTPSQR
jgi:hypothetical protein